MDLERKWLWRTLCKNFYDFRIFTESYVSQFPSLWQNYLTTLWRRKDLFWFTVSAVSVHDQLSPLVWSLWWGRTSCWKGVEVQSHSPYGSWGEDRMRTRAGTDILFRGTVWVAQLLKVCSTSSFHHLPIMPSNYELINGKTH
jgi:hypothetical protein